MRIAILMDETGEVRNSEGLKAALRHPVTTLRPHAYAFGHEAREHTQSTTLAIPRRRIGFDDSRFRILHRRLQLDRVRALHLAGSGRLALIARLLAWKLQIPLICNHDDLVTHGLADAIASILVRPGLRHGQAACEAVLVPAEATRERLIASGWAAHRVHVWRSGVDVDQFSPGRRSKEVRSIWGVSDQRPAILCSAQVAAPSGRELLPALSEILRQYRIPHRFIVMGNGGAVNWLRGALPEAFFTGPCSRESEAVTFASADIALSPGSGGAAWDTALKAQASGVPVILEEGSGASEFFVAGKTGYTCRAGSDQDFACRLGQLLVDPARRASMSMASTHYAMTRSWTASVATLFDAYARVLRLSTEHPATVGIRPSRTAAPVRQLPSE